MVQAEKKLDTQQEAKDDTALYWRADLLYRKKELSEAEEIALAILERTEDLQMKANCHILLGNIWIDQGKYDRATSAHEKARLFAENHGKPDTHFKALANLAKIALFQKRYDEAEHLLKEAISKLVLSENPTTEYEKLQWINHGYTYNLLAHIAFQKRDFQAYHELSVKSRDGFVQAADQMNIAALNSSVGVSLILLGKQEDGYRSIIKAQRKIKMHASDRYYILNLAAQVLYFRCKGYDPAILVDEVREYAESRSDAILAQWLEFMMTWDCQKLAEQGAAQ